MTGYKNSLKTKKLPFDTSTDSYFIKKNNFFGISLENYTDFSLIFSNFLTLYKKTYNQNTFYKDFITSFYSLSKNPYISIEDEKDFAFFFNEKKLFYKYNNNSLIIRNLNQMNHSLNFLLNAYFFTKVKTNNVYYVAELQQLVNIRFFFERKLKKKLIKPAIFIYPVRKINLKNNSTFYLKLYFIKKRLRVLKYLSYRKNTFNFIDFNEYGIIKPYVSAQQHYKFNIYSINQIKFNFYFQYLLLKN